MNNAAIVRSRYERAQALQQGLEGKTVALNTTVIPHWIGDTDYFWYEQTTRTGKQYRLVNAQTATNQPAFDHADLATALTAASGRQVDADDLPISQIVIGLAPLRVSFAACDKHWVFDGQDKTCRELNVHPADWVVSPNGKKAIVERDHNLWLINIDTGKEQALTRDGEPDNKYGGVSTAWGEQESASLQVLWSPDSSRIFTLQRDTRLVKSTPVVHHVPLDGRMRPVLAPFKVAYPGDENIEEFRLLVIDVDTGHVTDADYRQIVSNYNSVWGFFESRMGWWAKNNRIAYFLEEVRGGQTVRVVEFDTDTGATRVLFEETSDTYVNFSLNTEDFPLFRYLSDSNELIWNSERSGWSHLYLYDMNTGKLKNTITKGEWLVRDILHVDAERRELLVHTAARKKGRDPYYRDVCRVNIDTGELTTLVSSDHEYVVMTQECLAFRRVMSREKLHPDHEGVTGASPSGRYFVVTRSRADEVPVNLLLDKNGKQILDIEKPDLSGLPDGWQWPEPVKLTAADGKTDIYGVVFRPSDFSPDKKYPILNYRITSPYLASVAKGSFSNEVFFGGFYLPVAAWAELGFIVVVIDGRGTSLRHKAFQDEGYGWIPSCNNMDDTVAGIRQLAQKYPYMDLDRVGLCSPMGASTGVLTGLLDYPEFFKVGVAGRLEDSRLMGGPVWADRFEGLSHDLSDPRHPEYKVDKLQGKLLLMHGMVEHCNSPACSFRVVEALQKANKDFDILILPNEKYGLASSYLLRRAWDYMVEHLQGSEPPQDFKLRKYLNES